MCNELIFLTMQTNHTATIFSLPFQSLPFCRFFYENFPHPSTLEVFETIQACVIKDLIACVRSRIKNEVHADMHIHDCRPCVNVVFPLGLLV